MRIKQPTLYIPHGGGPCFFMDIDPPGTWDGLALWLRSFPTALPEKPSALLIVSAHWEEPVFTVNNAQNPSMLFDYYGFPEHTYQLSYPAPGSPLLAQQVIELIQHSGFASASNAERGYDHGIFVPMLLSFPEADIPVVQLSLKQGLNPAEHIALGRALAPLRGENVLIIGSGLSYHNLRRFRDPNADDLAASKAFDDWLLEDVVENPNREFMLQRWQDAPAARIAHPREEHLLPLMVCAGAASGEPAKRAFTDVILGKHMSAIQFGMC